MPAPFVAAAAPAVMEALGLGTAAAGTAAAAGAGTAAAVGTGASAVGGLAAVGEAAAAGGTLSRFAAGAQKIAEVTGKVSDAAAMVGNLSSQFDSHKPGFDPSMSMGIDPGYTY